MKKLTGVVGVLVIGLMLFSGLSLSQAEEEKERKELQIVLGAGEKCPKMTYLKFADILAGVMNIEMPAGTQRLSETELFEVQANMMAERGITLFLDSEPDGLVTCGMVANVLYGALIGPSTESVEAKIEYLAGLDYLGACAPSDILCAREIITALNIPALSKAIAEGYSPPRGIARGRTGVEFSGIDPAPTNPAPEIW